MLVRVKAKKGHWNGAVFVPMGQTFEFEGSLEGMGDRLEPADGTVAETQDSDSGQDAPPEMDWGALPASIIDALKGAGLDTPGKAAAASDDSLLAIDGIGPAAVKAIRGQIGK